MHYLFPNCRMQALQYSQTQNANIKCSLHSIHQHELNITSSRVVSTQASMIHINS